MYKELIVCFFFLNTMDTRLVVQIVDSVTAVGCPLCDTLDTS